MEHDNMIVRTKVTLKSKGIEYEIQMVLVDKVRNLTSKFIYLIEYERNYRILATGRNHIGSCEICILRVNIDIWSPFLTRPVDLL